eukprot:scaffold1719_cov186-Amphora_coffeaeformis.AAC.9
MVITLEEIRAPKSTEQVVEDFGLISKGSIITQYYQDEKTRQMIKNPRHGPEKTKCYRPLFGWISAVATIYLNKRLLQSQQYSQWDPGDVLFLSYDCKSGEMPTADSKVLDPSQRERLSDRFILNVAAQCTAYLAKPSEAPCLRIAEQ